MLADASCHTLPCAEHPPEDPLHKTPCVLDALRLRHTVRCNLRQGKVGRRRSRELQASYRSAGSST